MKLWTFIITLFLCSVAPNTIAQEEENIFDYWLDEFNLGYGFYEKEDFSSAITHFTNAVNVIDQIDFISNTETEYYPLPR